MPPSRKLMGGFQSTVFADCLGNLVDDLFGYVLDQLLDHLLLLYQLNNLWTAGLVCVFIPRF